MARKKTTALRPLIVGYARVSTSEQATDGVSLADQERRIRALAVAKGVEIDEMIVDAGFSAKTLKRPGMTRLLAGVKAGEFGTVICVKLDRLTRSVRDLATILDLFDDKHADRNLLSLSESIDTSTAAGRLMLNVVVSIAQWEREKTAELTRDGLQHSRQKREAYGHAAFGWNRVGDCLEAIPEEQDALATLRMMRANGAPLRVCAEWLEAHGFTPRQGGKRWHCESIKKMLGSRIATETEVAA